MATFETHTGLTLETRSEGGIYTVLLIGDREKVLYSGPSQVEQQRVYRDTKALYQQREQEAKEVEANS